MINMTDNSNMTREDVVAKWNGRRKENDYNEEFYKIPDPDPKYEDNLQTKLKRKVGYTILINMFQPAPSEEKGAYLISLWECYAKRKQGIRMRMRPGRAFARMFPWKNQSELAELNDWYRELMMLENAEIIIKCSGEAEDFKLAYNGMQAPMANPYFDRSQKGLVYSCMRHNFNNLPIHPVEVYASGDFTIVWAELETMIAGRCVIFDKACNDRRAGPIYGISDTVFNSLESYIYDGLGARPAHIHDGWEGARLIKRTTNYSGHIIGPYLDLDPQHVREEDDYLIISESGYLSTESTDGVYEAGICCCECGDNIPEDNYSSDEDGSCYCDDCYNEIFSRCDRCESSYHVNNESSCDVYVIGYGGRSIQETWCEYCSDNYAQLTLDDEYWDCENTYTTHDGETISINDYENDYTECCLTNEIYHNNDVATLANGEGRASIEYMTQEEDWTENSDGEWENDQSEIEFAA